VERAHQGTRPNTDSNQRAGARSHQVMRQRTPSARDQTSSPPRSSGPTG
jgi:hypothetical protein